MDFGFLKKLNKTQWIGAAIIAGVLLFAAWELFMGFAPAAVKVIDERITFKFTAYHDRDEYFASYALENTKNTKVKAYVRVELSESGMNGHAFRAIKGLNDYALLGPQETKSFVTKFQLPKPKDRIDRVMDVRVKVRRVTRA